MTDNTLRPDVLLDHQEIRRDLTDRLVSELYGSDLDHIGDGELVGFTAPPRC